MRVVVATDEREELRAVRRQLDTLVCLRRLSPFTAFESADYDRLIAVEARLLTANAAAA